MNQKYYDILEIPQDCSLNELKWAFRKKAKQYHPDLNDSPDANSKFIEINEAYIILSKVKSGIEDYQESYNGKNQYSQDRHRARQKARDYAKMRYEDYINSPIYKATRVFEPIIKISAILFGAFVFLAPFIFITYRKVNDLKMIPANFAYLAGVLIFGFFFGRMVYKEIKYN